MAVDKLGAFSFLFVAVIFVTYAGVAKLQYDKIEKDTYRLQILSTRCFMCLPLYTIFLYLSLLEPHLYEAMMILVTFFEGYTFYCFFTFLVVNMGGPTETVRVMKQKNQELCCTKYCCSFCQCYSEDKVKFYKTAAFWMWHFVVSRTIIIILATIGFYSYTDAGHVVFIALSVLAFAFLVVAFSSLVNLYENVYEHCTNINGIFKLMLLKTSVGLIAGLGIVENFMVLAGSHYQPTGNNDDDDTDMTQRAYCLLMLIIFVVMSILFGPIFSQKIGRPQIMYDAEQYIDWKGESKPSFSRFWYDLLSFRDVYAVMVLKENPLIDDDVERSDKHNTM